MITIDPRAGSKDLVAPLTKRGLPIEERLMEFGDLAFTGRGYQDRPISIGIEHKTLSDLLARLADKRFTGHQMPGLRRTYEGAWLLVEGRCLVDTKGYVVQLRRGGLQRIAWGRGDGMERKTLMKMLMTIEHCAGVRVKVTETREETLDWIHAFYGWWTGKKFEDHGEDIGWAPPEAWAAEAAEHGELKPWSGARQWARLVPGLGSKYAKEAASFVKHVPEDLGKVTEDQWAELKHEGRRLGQSRARAIREWMSGKR